MDISGKSSANVKDGHSLHTIRLVSTISDVAGITPEYIYLHRFNVFGWWLGWLRADKGRALRTPSYAALGVLTTLRLEFADDSAAELLPLLVYSRDRDGIQVSDGIHLHLPRL